MYELRGNTSRGANQFLRARSRAEIEAWYQVMSADGACIRLQHGGGAALFAHTKGGVLRVWVGTRLWAVWQGGDENVEFTDIGRRAYGGVLPTDGFADFMLYFYALFAFVAATIHGKVAVKRKAAVVGERWDAGAFGIEVWALPRGNTVVFDEGDSARVLLSGAGALGRTVRVPSDVRPLPNGGSRRVFTRDNTEDFADVNAVDEALRGFRPQLGRCYTNSAEIVRRLNESDYGKSHSVVFFAGWLVDGAVNTTTHHAWVVVDNKHILDASADTSAFVSERVREMELFGRGSDITREEYADVIHEKSTGKFPFSSYAGCGRVVSGVYVGVPSDKLEAVSSYDALVDKYPNHEDYRNIDKATRTNELNRIYYAKYGRD